MPAQNLSNSGHHRLVWRPEDESISGGTLTFEVQQARDPNFETAKTIYIGPDMASFISGLKDGDYYYRVRTRAEDTMSAWSEPVHVQVAHQSLQLAFTLFGLGAVVFLATLILVVHGTRNSDDH